MYLWAFPAAWRMWPLQQLCSHQRWLRGGVGPEHLQAVGNLNNQADVNAVFCSMADVAAGLYSSFAVTNDGRVEAWGLNNYGQLALPASTTMFHTPSVVQALGDHRVAAVAGGQHHALAVTEVHQPAKAIRSQQPVHLHTLSVTRSGR